MPISVVLAIWYKGTVSLVLSVLPVSVVVCEPKRVRSNVNFRSNQPVELIFGPLLGRTGLFVRSIHPARVVVEVRLKQQAVQIELPRDMIRLRPEIQGEIT